MRLIYFPSWMFTAQQRTTPVASLPIDNVTLVSPYTVRLLLSLHYRQS